METILKSFKLYATPTFLEGVARLIDFSGSLNQYNYSETSKEADARAIQSDWENVGLDILNAVNQFEGDEYGTTRR